MRKAGNYTRGAPYGCHTKVIVIKPLAIKTDI
jgi:hypothetical protein